MKTKFKLGICFITFISSTGFYYTQNKEKVKNQIYGGFGYMSYSGAYLNQASFNSAISAKNYTTLNPFQHGFGGGGGFCINNIYLGGEGGGFVKNKLFNQTNNMTIESGYGFFNLGYVYSIKKRSFITPLIGIGTGGYVINIKDKTSISSFEDQISRPSNVSEMECGGLLLQAKFAYQYFISANHSSGLFFGIMAGYRYNPANWTMKINNQAVNGPQLNMNGIHLSIILGGGSLTNKN